MAEYVSDSQETKQEDNYKKRGQEKKHYRLFSGKISSKKKKLRDIRLARFKVDRKEIKPNEIKE